MIWITIAVIEYLIITAAFIYKNQPKAQNDREKVIFFLCSLFWPITIPILKVIHMCIR